MQIVLGRGNKVSQITMRVQSSVPHGIFMNKPLKKKISHILRLQDHIALEDYEIHDGMNLELYYQ